MFGEGVEVEMDRGASAVVDGETLSIILDLIRTRRALTRPELGRVSGLGRTVVSGPSTIRQKWLSIPYLMISKSCRPSARMRRCPEPGWQTDAWTVIPVRWCRAGERLNQDGYCCGERACHRLGELGPPVQVGIGDWCWCTG
ncbi:hypothetical protein FBY31_2504 [Arthrobacter sp. SLBN-100]|nr:hypothetical protein FBY31_2504 [Arthrobacter sp. SLBN-100]